MWRLGLDLARRRVLALLAVVVAVLGGVALVTATGVLAESGLRSHVPAGRLAGAGVVVTAPQGVPATLPARLAAVPGVTAAVGDVSLPAAVLDRVGKPVAAGDPAVAGHGWSSVQLLPHAVVSGSAPHAEDEVALDSATATAAGIRVGDRARLVVVGVPTEDRVTAVVRTGVRGIWLSDATAAAQRPGTVDLVGLRVGHGGAERVRRELRGSGLEVLTGAARGDAATPTAVGSRSMLLLLSSSLAGVLLLVIGFVVAAALGVAASAMRPELSLLRAVGATPRQVRRLLARQALAVSALGVLPGAALGYLLAGALRARLVDLGLLDSTLPFSWSPLPALLAVVLVLGTVHLAALAAGWRPSRLPAVDAVASAKAEPRTPSRVRAGIGAALVLGATVLAGFPLAVRTEEGAAATSVAGLLAVLGLPLVGPLVVQRLATALARRLPRRTPPAGWLTVTGTAGSPRRATSAVTSLAMVVVLVLTYVLVQTTLSTAASRDLSRGTLGDAVVTAPGVGGVGATAVETLAATPGVRAAVPVSSTTVTRTYDELGDPTTEAESALVLPAQAGAVLDLGVRRGSLADLHGATAALSTDAARSSGVEVGEQVPLQLADGARVQARVVAVYARGLGFGPVAVSADLARGRRVPLLAERVLLRTDGTVATRTALGRTVAALPGAVLSAAGPAGGADTRTEADASSGLNLATLVVLLGYLLLSIANRMVAATVQRRQEVALLRLVGATPAQVRAVLRGESALVAAAAVGAGLLLSAVPLGLLGVAFLGRPWAAGPLWLLPAVVVGVAAVALGTTELPLRRMLRAPASAALARE
ncbi:putative ABC transport system permease protein [Motilibacter rhizosphaerae]|uniref:Putative ABC transport system permease protein n=1 Tax=Motilibacter rhizosphaerae TaxID=598652 RepID=A0A4Q7NAS1_9ACTN|nr:ABC transporter permease [Motilibacter rhizosphaerae]RZS80041.1 putative ABC transport system permease protein [Motilibacter rhizosphaerae]